MHVFVEFGCVAPTIVESNTSIDLLRTHIFGQDLRNIVEASPFFTVVMGSVAVVDFDRVSMVKKAVGIALPMMHWPLLTRIVTAQMTTAMVERTNTMAHTMSPAVEVYV